LVANLSSLLRRLKGISFNETIELLRKKDSRVVATLATLAIFTLAISTLAIFTLAIFTLAIVTLRMTKARWGEPAP